MNKHEVNIKKGKLINFQIGIIAVVSFCYVMHEVSHYTPIHKKKVASAVEDINIYNTMGPVLAYTDPKIVNINVPRETKPKPVIPVVEPKAKPIVVDSKVEIKPTEKKNTIPEVRPITKTTISAKATKKSIGINKKAIPQTLNIKSVDALPVFPGCDKYSTNNQKAACFQEKIQRMIYKKFDRSIGNELGITGLQRISLYFEIDSKGNVTNIKAHNQHPEFIKEAKRVASLLPKMQPAKRKGANVKMAYNVPIVFKTAN